MNDLIERLKKAEAGSRELSDDVLLALGSTLISPASCNAGVGGCWTPSGKHGYDARPCPTTSLDAALALVPEGLIWDATSTGQAWVMDPDCVPCGQQWIGKAATPALALCIAILKAKEA